MGFFDFLSTKKPSNQSHDGVKVKEIMTPNPIVVSGTVTIATIEEIFGKNRIWSIYVGDPDKYVGVITRNDLKFRGKNKSKSSPAYSIMSNGVVSIDENADIEDAKTLLYNKKINGLAVTRNGKHCGIITRYDIKKRSDPESKDAADLNQQGFRLAKMNKFEEAIIYFEKALLIDKNFIDALNNHGWASSQLGRYEESISFYENAKKIDPKNIRAWRAIGWNLARIQRYDEALAHIDTAISFDSMSERSWNFKGEILLFKCEFEDAIACFDKALVIKPDYAEAWNNRGIALREFNRYKETPSKAEVPRHLTWLQKISKIIKTNPKDRKIQEKLEKIEKAKIEVTSKIDYIHDIEIKKFNDDIQSTYDKAIKSSSKQEEIFLAKRIKNLQQIVNSKWETLDKLQRIQHYFERILAVGDISVSLKDFGLQEFSEKEIEDFVIDTKIGIEELYEKIESTNFITSPAINPDTGEEGLKDILDVVRSKKEVIKEY